MYRSKLKAYTINNELGDFPDNIRKQAKKYAEAYRSDLSHLEMEKIKGLVVDDMIRHYKDGNSKLLNSRLRYLRSKNSESVKRMRSSQKEYYRLREKKDNIRNKTYVSSRVTFTRPAISFISPKPTSSENSKYEINDWEKYLPLSVQLSKEPSSRNTITEGPSITVRKNRSVIITTKPLQKVKEIRSEMKPSMFYRDIIVKHMKQKESARYVHFNYTTSHRNSSNKTSLRKRGKLRKRLFSLSKDDYRNML